MTKKKSSKPGPWIRLEQWIEVEIDNGVAATRYFPTNGELLKIAARMDPPPEVVFRRFNFPGGVPLEYAWTQPNKNHLANGGACIQRLRFQDWTDLIGMEAGGHARAFGPGFLRRSDCHDA